jgi:hypothetical protein
MWGAFHLSICNVCYVRFYHIWVFLCGLKYLEVFNCLLMSHSRNCQGMRRCGQREDNVVNADLQCQGLKKLRDKARNLGLQDGDPQGQQIEPRNKWDQFKSQQKNEGFLKTIQNISVDLMNLELPEAPVHYFTDRTNEHQKRKVDWSTFPVS